MFLTNDINPQKVKVLSLTEKAALCEEIRSLLINVVSKNGGHLASNLGTVELIVAMHSVFSTPADSFVFDVGHQAYTHKILTGRLAAFERLRQEGGISGFPKPSESKHDAFIGGHSSISVSAGLGIAAAKAINREDGSVVVVAGDGSFTGGGIYEGLNNAGRTGFSGRSGKNLIVVLNDNGMCISKSSGALAAYLSQIRTKGYYEAKNRVKKVLGRTTLGKGVSGVVGETKRFVKGALIPENLFENLGFKYFGPVDGHNLEELIFILEHVKAINRPCLIHVKTKKGKGYVPAEENAGHYHGLGANRAPATETLSNDAYSDVFGKEITRLGSEDKRICLISAAMKYATGCNYFAKEFPERFFDVGIAEAHAVTFAAGLASTGKVLPVFAVYSTFMQRCFDQLLHDTAIEKLRLVLAVDRAGLSGEDGATHQGTFDVGLLSLIPGTTIYAPLTAEELRLCLKKALYEDTGIAAVRYPRGIAYNPVGEEPDADYVLYRSEAETYETLIITYGRPVKPARKLLKHGADLLRLVRLHPLPDKVFEIANRYKNVVFFEEGSLHGGVAERLSMRVPGMTARAVEGFVPIADLERQMKLCGFDAESMKEFAGL
ncbi:MAG: 1-deoxy-D-xylulose-5-phosphate synthase [Oscillospiraceae bacterium]|nr:1-deoxy-D-xylulose-5-phosphate synthase [Oscillospiraceae bacterium]